MSHTDLGRSIITAWLLLGVLIPLGAGEDRAQGEPVSAATPVAVVNGQGISLREIEDALLKQEGVEQVMDLVKNQLDNTDWGRLADGDIIVQMKGWRLSRAMLSAQLLGEHAAKVREEFINIRLVEQALAKEGVAVDQAAIDAEIVRMERRLRDGLEARGQPQVDFRSFIQQTQKMPLEEFARQPGFRMLTGLHLLVHRRGRVELTEADLRTYLDAHLDRYRLAEAVDLSDLFIPFQKEKDAAGQDRVTDEEKTRLEAVMRQFHAGIRNGQVTFAKTWHAFGRMFDQNTGADGRLGWIARSGNRGVKGARQVAAKVMEQAFAAQPPFPVLLEPVVHDTGIDLVQVHGRRAAQEPVFSELRERLVQDLVDSELEARTQRLLNELRRAAAIDYASLPELVRQRSAQAGLPGAAAPGPVAPAGK
jgi:hypothetical protein